MAEMKWNCLYFDEWVKGEGLDLIRGHKVDDVFTQPLKPWARTGGTISRHWSLAPDTAACRGFR